MKHRDVDAVRKAEIEIEHISTDVSDAQENELQANERSASGDAAPLLHLC